MATLDRTIRKELEKVVRRARIEAEKGARKAMNQLGVAEKNPAAAASLEERKIRLRLRAHAKQIGDNKDPQTDRQAIDRLVEKCAYEHWHRMLFARFLAENGLLIHPAHEAPVTLEDVREIANAEGESWVAVAGAYAEVMLPQIFRQGDPVLDISLPAETQHALEEQLSTLPPEVFLAEDSLGWVYQFWQAEEKDRVNRSGKKIGPQELPAVTQLFTEDYMVEFLLHNTLGAWWAGKRFPYGVEAESEETARAACALDGLDWTYLRFAIDLESRRWRPASGTFDGWPTSSAEITVFDPCMGSGHFLVFALPILAAMREAEEGLSPSDAYVAVLRDNLSGLEIDERCTQIAAFNLALATWRAIGFSSLPALQVACSGLAPNVRQSEWVGLVDRAIYESNIAADRDTYDTKDNLFSARIRGGFAWLYELFEKAPTLGSLLDPRARHGSLYQADFNLLESFFESVIRASTDGEIAEAAVAAAGMAKSAELLSRRYTLVTTNVPYLGRGKQGDDLKANCERSFPDAKADLATCFVERCLSFCIDGGTAALVTPQNWLFLSTYKKMRLRMLQRREWNCVARLGEYGFESSQAAGAFTALVTLTTRVPDELQEFASVDASNLQTPREKTLSLTSLPSTRLRQVDQVRNPDSCVLTSTLSSMPLLAEYAESYHGISTTDYALFGRRFWEFATLEPGWVFQQSTVRTTRDFGGRESVLLWENGNGRLRELYSLKVPVVITGLEAWNQKGVAVSQMRDLPVTRYTGEAFDDNTAVIVPRRPDDFEAIWAFCSSPDYCRLLRSIDQSIKVTYPTLVKVPFDLDYWTRVAAERSADCVQDKQVGDPTQWLFNGCPRLSTSPLLVAVARLLAFCWPRQLGAAFSGAGALDDDGLHAHADVDGIVCLQANRDEPAASLRLRDLLADAYGQEWSTSKELELIADSGFGGKSLGDWLGSCFFDRHCELFHQRPFIWHIWDGRLDGFHALVNYHKLAAPNGEGRRSLEKLIYTYLGDWIDRQRADVANGVDGAEARLAAAEHLKNELEKILHGEPPYDIFVRWKPLGEQPIGWEPDINDGVRINIRPFLKAKPLEAKARNACILRTTPKITWGKDRGKEPKRDKTDYPWFWGWDEKTQDFAGGEKFDGNRWNDLHYSRKVKEAARERHAAAAKKERSK